MVNINKLKAKLTEKDMNVDMLAKATGIERSKMYRKIKADGKTFTIDEVDSISYVLRLNLHEQNEIFFNQFFA